MAVFVLDRSGRPPQHRDASSRALPPRPEGRGFTRKLMKMNSNNEQDYRHFKGVGASYESGVVYSHQKLVVSEVQTKTRKYNAARLMRHIGHHFPGDYEGN